MQARISLTTPLPCSCCPPLLAVSPPDTTPVMYTYFMCFSSAPSLIPFPSSPFPPFLSPFSSPLVAIVSSVRRGPVLFTSLSLQARVRLLCLQPLPETRVQSLHPVQPSPALLFLQHWASPRPPTPHHPSKYPRCLPALLPNPWCRPRPSRHP